MMIFKLTAGLAIFLYGIWLSARSLEDIAGASLRLIVRRLTRKPFLGFITGVIAAMSLQSSGAAMLMLVAFASTGIISLIEAIPVILGAGVGSTVIVQIISFKISAAAPVLITVGYILYVFLKGDKVQDIGKAIFSLGFLLFGMGYMKQALPDGFASSSAMFSIGRFLADAPFWALVFAALITAAFQSSLATLELLLIFAATGVFNIDVLLPFVLGANLGSCATALLGSIKGSREGKKIAYGELLIRGIIVVLLYIFMSQYKYVVALTSSDPVRQVANAHLIFSLVATVVFFPIARLTDKFVDFMVPMTAETDIFAPRYLDQNLISNPPVALGQAAREVIRMGDIVEKMFADSRSVFFSNDEKLLRKLVADDDKVDTLHESITEYLTQISEAELSERKSENEIELLHITVELEHIADVISKDISQLLEKKIRDGYYFSDAGFREILALYDATMENLHIILNTIPLRDRELAKKVIGTTKLMVLENRQLFRSHIERLHRGLRETEETSSLHLDFLGCINQINIHISYIAYAILGKI